MQLEGVSETIVAQYVWSIHAFSQLDHAVNSETRSAVFDLAGCQWQLCICPGGDDCMSAGFVSIWLCNWGPVEVQTEYTFAIVDKNRDELAEFPSGDATFLLGKWWGVKLGLRSDILHPSKRLLDQDVLRIQCEIQVTAPRFAAQRSLGHCLGHLLDSGAHR